MSNLLTISYGDTTDGPRIMEAALRIMVEAGAVLEIEAVQLGYEMERLEFENGFDEEGLNKIRRARVLLKAPTLKDVTTPLHAALGEGIMIFEPGESSPSAMLEAAVAVLEHLEMHDVAIRIAASLGKTRITGLKPEEFAEKIIDNLA